MAISRDWLEKINSSIVLHAGEVEKCTDRQGIDRDGDDVPDNDRHGIDQDAVINPDNLEHAHDAGHGWIHASSAFPFEHRIQIRDGSERGAETCDESDDFMSFHPNLLVFFDRISRAVSAAGCEVGPPEKAQRHAQWSRNSFLTNY